MTQFLDYEGLKTFAKTIDSKFVRKGSIDTTFAEVVASLPTDVTKIKKHLYLVKNASSTESQNVYSEYIYIGEIGTGKTYDASKWEKLGDFRASIDLSGYSTKSETIKSIKQQVSTSGIDKSVYLTITKADGGSTDISISAASNDKAGVMTVDNFNKLQGIADGANKTIVDSTLSSTSTNPVQNKVINSNLTNINNELGKKATKDVATTSANGLMASTDKEKLDGIAAGANKTIVDSELSASSTNPVQNKVIKAALDGKCQGDDVRLNTGANVKVNGIALGNTSKNINTNGFYVIEKIFTSRPTTVSTASKVNKVAYYNGYLYGITAEGQICNNYANKEQFGVVETTADNDTLPKAPTNATYYNKENGFLYYNTGTTLEKVWDDLSSLTIYADSDDVVGLLNVGDYNAIMDKVDESPIQVITSEQINSLFT